MVQQRQRLTRTPVVYQCCQVLRRLCRSVSFVVRSLGRAFKVVCSYASLASFLGHCVCPGVELWQALDQTTVSC